MIVWTGGHLVQIIPGGAYPAWCDRCMSSSAVRVRFYIWCTDGPRFAGLWWACQVCDPDRFDGDEGEAPEGDAGMLV